MDANDFEATETLKNGVTVKIRAIRPSDKAGIADAFGKLDPESVYTRFFQVKGSLSDQELIAATEVDFENVVAMVVTIESGGKETIIGGGRYLAFDLPSVRSAVPMRMARTTRTRTTSWARRLASWKMPALR